MDADSLYPDYQALFRAGLMEYGFRPNEEGALPVSFDGKLDVTWTPAAGGPPVTTAHAVRVTFPAAFPFAKPSVTPLDADPPVSGGRHQAPGALGGTLCLYADEDNGWYSAVTVREFLARIREWFLHYHQDDWQDGDRPPDLHLYFARRDGGVMMFGEDWVTPLGESDGRFGVWQKSKERAFAGHPTSGSAVPALTHGDRILVPLGLRGAPYAGIGLWFRLAREPVPRDTLSGLLLEIDAAAGRMPGWSAGRLRGLVGERVHKRDAHVALGLCYPGPAGAKEWLFLRTVITPGAKGARRWERIAGAIPVVSCEAARVDGPALMRRSGPIAAAVAGKDVLIFGMGAVGSSVAVLLAKSGVPGLRLVDSDRMRPGNSVRHLAGLSNAGRPKTAATALEVLDHAPDCEVAVEDASWDPGVLTGWMREADLVVDATANPPFSLLVNELAVAAGKPAVFAAAYRNGRIGRLRLVRPGLDPCLVCHEDGHARADDYPLVPRGEEEAGFVEEGCGVPTVEASAVDIEATANSAARLALRTLESREGSDNLYLIVNDKVPGATGILAVPGIHSQRWEPIPDCQACGKVPT
jgi:molybdopterin/thiamine biosynthesis adenylyltransferase